MEVGVLTALADEHVRTARRPPDQKDDNWVPDEAVGHMSLRSQCSWILGGRTAFAFFQWATLIVLARWDSPRAVGIMALALAIANPLLLATNLGLRLFQSTDAQDRYEFADYLGLRLATSTGAFLFLLLIIWLARFDHVTAPVVFAMGLAKIVESISETFYGLFQRHEYVNRIGQSLLWRGASAFALFMLVFGLSGSLAAAAFGYATAWLAILLLVDMRRGARVMQELSARDSNRRLVPAREFSVSPRWNYANLRSLATDAAPAGVLTVVISLDVYVPRYFIDLQLGREALGQFAAMCYFIILGSTMLNSIGMACCPRLVELHAAGKDAAFIRVLYLSAGFAAGMGAMGVVAAALFGDTILFIVYGPEFAIHMDCFIWLMLAGMIEYVNTMLNCGTSAVRAFGAQALYMAMVTLGTAAIVPVCIIIWGLTGAAIALTISNLLRTAVTVALLVDRIWFSRATYAT